MLLLLEIIMMNIILEFLFSLVFLRQGLLASLELKSPTYLCLLNPEMQGLYHHSQLLNGFYIFL